MGRIIKHSQDMPREYASHTVSIEKGSLLHDIFGSDTLAVNSFHHQAIKQVPQGFRVTATAPDGIIEAVERSGRLAPAYADGGAWILGVQFHPEAITNGGNTEFLPIFQKLVEEAAK